MCAGSGLICSKGICEHDFNAFPHYLVFPEVLENRLTGIKSPKVNSLRDYTAPNYLRAYIPRLFT